MYLDQMETPALVLDMDRFEENLRLMMDWVQQNHLELRPHFKSHKCPHLAHMQIQYGAKGITCAKVSEAEDLVDSGIENVLIANQITQPSKVARVAFLAGCADITVCVDNAANIAQLNAAAALQNTKIKCLIEYEVGMKRCGVSTHEDFLTLAQQIVAAPNLEFAGIQAYAGNLSHEKDYFKRKSEAQKVEEKIGKLKQYVENAGIRVETVSGVSTGTVEFKSENSVYTELQTGSYAFMDTDYGAMNLRFQNSLFLLTQVISVTNDHIVTDGGIKSIAVDHAMPEFLNYPGVPVKMSEEHGCIPKLGNMEVGDRLLMIPGHCCTTANLHDKLYLVRGGKVENRVQISSRGKSI